MDGKSNYKDITFHQKDSNREQSNYLNYPKIILIT